MPIEVGSRVRIDPRACQQNVFGGRVMDRYANLLVWVVGEGTAARIQHDGADDYAGPSWQIARRQGRGYDQHVDERFLHEVGRELVIGARMRIAEGARAGNTDEDRGPEAYAGRVVHIGAEFEYDEQWNPDGYRAYHVRLADTGARTIVNSHWLEPVDVVEAQGMQIHRLAEAAGHVDLEPLRAQMQRIQAQMQPIAQRYTAGTGYHPWEWVGTTTAGTSGMTFSGETETEQGGSMALAPGTRVRVHEGARSRPGAAELHRRFINRDGTVVERHDQFADCYKVRFADDWDHETRWVGEKYLSPLYEIGTQVTVNREARNGPRDMGTSPAGYAQRTGRIIGEFDARRTPVGYRVEFDDGDRIVINSRHLTPVAPVAEGADDFRIGRRIRMPRGYAHNGCYGTVEKVGERYSEIRLECDADQIITVNTYEIDFGIFQPGMPVTIDPRAVYLNRRGGGVRGADIGPTVYLTCRSDGGGVKSWIYSRRPGGGGDAYCDERFLIPAAIDPFTCPNCNNEVTEYDDLLVDGVRWCSTCAVRCDSCDSVHPAANLEEVASGAGAARGRRTDGTLLLCPNCRFTCPNCDNVRDTRFRQQHPETGVDYCERCLHSCARCSTWYLTGEGNPEEEGYCATCNRWGCKCVSPGLEFLVGNHEGMPVPNDTRVRVELPSGVVTDRGIREMQEYFNNLYYTEADRTGQYSEDFLNLKRIVGNLDREWQTKQGNFTKRLSKAAYKDYGIKVDPKHLTMIGNIGADHSKGDVFWVEVTRDLNQSPTAFGHAASCWWQSYFLGRCMLKNNGGFGLRAFSGETGNDVVGRAWVIPLKRNPNERKKQGLLPTFNSLEPDAFMVFNGYGVLSNYAPARVIAHLSGMTYRKVSFESGTMDGRGNMYINGGSAYMVGSPEILDEVGGDFGLKMDGHSDTYEQEREFLEQQAARVAGAGTTVVAEMDENKEMADA